jgi:hypothetical protein
MRLGVVESISHVLYPILRVVFHCSLYGSYCIFIGFLCGYPMGAKVTNELLTDGKISVDEANHIIGFANNSGPGYIQNYLILSLLGDNEKRLLYLSYYYVPILIYGIMRGLKTRFDKSDEINNITPKQNRQKVQNHMSNLLDGCIMDTFRTISKLCGYVIIFSVISEYIGHIGFFPDLIKGILLMGIEITNGANYVATTIEPELLKEILCFCGTILGGGSIFMQTKSVCTQKGIRLEWYLLQRGIIAGITGGYILITHIFFS